MVSNFLISTFLVGAIISVVVPIYTLIKVRKSQGLIKNILMGALLSLASTLFYGFAISLLLVVFNFLQDPQLSVVLFILMLFLEVSVLSLVYWYFNTKIVKTPLDEKQAGAMTFGYMITFTWNNITMFLNLIVAGFALNAGNLSEYVSGDQLKVYENALQNTSPFHYLSLAFFVILNWAIFSRVFKRNMNDPQERKEVFMYLGLYGVLAGLISSQVIPAPINAVGFLVLTLYMLKDLRQKSWK